MPVQIQVAAVGLEASVQQALERAGRNAKINLNVDSKGIQAISQPLGKITGQADEFSKSMEAANARVLAFGASVGILNSVVQAFKGIINVTVEIEARMADINSVFQKSTSELNNFKKEMFNVARDTSTSFDTVSTAALELSRQGLAPVEVLTRLKDAMILSKLSGMDAAQSVEGLTAAINSFSKQGVTSAEVLNKVSAAAAKYAVSERDIIEGLKRAGPVAAQAGVSFEELGGIISAVQQKTARGGAVIGNAMKTIFTKIQDLGGLTQLKELGVDVVDLQGKILPATTILDNLAQKMKNLSQMDLSVIEKKIGGGFQISPLIAALEDYASKTSVAKGATEVMMTATDQAYARMRVLNETLAASMNKASVNLEQLGDQLGNLGVKGNMNDLLSFFNSLSSSISEALDGEGIGSEVSKGLVRGIGSVLMSSGLPIILAIIGKLTYNLVSFGVQSLKSFFGIGSAAKEINALAGSLTNTLMNNKGIQEAVLSLEGNRVAQARVLSEIMNGQLAMAQKMASIGSGSAAMVYQQTAGARKASSTSGTAAGGYMPEVSKENSDIQRGVGGARPSDRPVVIPNFAFGGGRVGTMVANSSEHMVPNYKGSGGTAIFNRDMVAKIGLPSGARPVSAAGGFVPNFAMKATDIIAATKATTWDEFSTNPDISIDGKKVIYRGQNTGLYTSNFISQSGPNAGQLKIQKASAREEAEKVVKMEKAGLFNLDADQLGGIALVSPRFGKGVGDLSVEAPVSEIGFFNYDKEHSGVSVDKNQYIKLNKVKTTNTPSGKDLQALQGDISNIFAGGVVELAHRLYGGTFDPASAGDFTQKLSSLSAAKKQELLPKSAQGELFEAAGKVALNTFKNMDSLFGASEQQRPFDFQNKKAIKQMFGIDAERGEAKRGGEKNFKGGKQAWSIVKKVFNDPAYNKKALESLKKQGMNMDYTKPAKEKTAETATTAAGGFIPNFVNQEYVLNTLQRIKNGTSGFSKQEQETFLAKFGGTASSGKGISLRQVFDHLDPDPAISPFVNKAYSSAGPTASTEQVFREFEKQIKSNPSALRNLVKSKGYIPNFANVSKIAKDNARVASNLIQSQNTDKRLMGNDLVNLYGNNFTQINEELGDKDAQQFEDYVIKKYNYRSGLDLKYGPSAAVDGYKISGNKIDLLEVKSGAWNSYDVLNKFLRALPENYGTGNQLDLWTKGKDSFSVNASLISPINKGFKATQGKMYKNSASGFLPNFADPLKEAISREVGAGVNPNQVYVDQHSSLKNSDNPMGLMVANRRDEPSGGWQGINRARKEGLNAQTYGAASGFVPNFAPQIGQISRAGIAGGKSLSDADIQLFNDSLKDVASRLKKGDITISKAMQEVDDYANIINTSGKNAQKLLVAGQSLVGAYENELSQKKQAAIDRLAEYKQSKIKLASSVLEDSANKKLKSTIEKQIDAYNKSSKSAADLAALQAKMIQSASKAGLSGSQTTALTQSASTLAGNRQESLKSKPEKDYLGTIFAVQAGLSLLAGATGEATEGFGKFVSILSGGLSNLATVGFAFQGFSQMAKNATGAFGKVVGNIGIYGAALMAGYEVFKLGKELYYEYSGANKRAADAANMLAKSAENASVKIDQYSPSGQKELNKRVDNILYNLQEGKVTKEGKFTEEANAANAINISEKDLPNVRAAMLTALGSGAFEEDLQKIATSNVDTKKYRHQADQFGGSGNEVIVNNLNTDQVLATLSTKAENKNAENLERMMKQLSTGNAQPLLDLKMTQQEIEQLKTGSYSAPGYNPERSVENSISPLKPTKEPTLLKLGGLTGVDISLVRKAAEETQKNQKEKIKEEINYNELVSTNLTKVLKNLSIESALRDALNKKSKEAVSNELTLQKSISDVMSDQTLSQDDKNKKIKQLELSSKNTLSILDNEKTRYKEISDLADKVASSQLSQGLEKPIRENMQKAISGLSDKKIASLGTDLGSKDDIKAAKAQLELEDLIKNSLKDAGIATENISKLQKEMLGPVIEYVTKRKQANTELSLEIDKGEKLLSIDEKRLEVAKLQAQLFSKLELGFSAKMGDREISNIKLQGQGSRVDLEKQIKLATPGTFKGITDPREILAKTQAIEKAAFEEKRKIDLQAQIEQIKIETDRAAYTEKNITALGQNTEAINNWIDAQSGIQANTAALAPLANSPDNKNINDIIAAEVKNQGLTSKFTNKEQNKLYLGSEKATEQNVIDFLKKLAYKESGFNPKASGDAGRFDGGSHGIFQLSKNDRKNYGIGEEMSIQDLQNPQTNTATAVTIMGKLLEKSNGTIAGMNGGNYTGGAAYWGPLRSSAMQQQTLQNAGTLVTGEGNAAAKLAMSGASGDELVKAAEKAASELGNKTNEAIGDSAKRLVDAANKMRAATVASEETTKSKELDQALERLKAAPGTFSQGMQKGMTDLKQQQLDFSYNMGQQLPKSFADNMASAMENVIMKGGDLKDSLREAATSFLNEISKANIKNMANTITSGIGNGIGNMFQQHAAGGPISGGSGMKDDVPSMLMGGEFVMNKKAVQKYGMNFMDRLNSGTLSHFASGGRVKEVSQNYGISSGGMGSPISSVISATDSQSSKIPTQAGPNDFQVPGYYEQGAISGKQNLLNYASQAFTSGKNDQIISGRDGAMIDLEGESMRLTNYGRTHGPMSDMIKEAKGQAFDLYKQQLTRDAEIEKARKDKIKANQQAFKMAIITSVVSAGMSAAGHAIGNGFQAGSANGGGFMGGMKGIYSGGDIGVGQNVGGLKNLFSGNYGLSQIGNQKQMLDMYNTNSGFAKMIGNRGIDPTSFGYQIPRAIPVRATGGAIGQASGIDTVPAMLSGGEFVMNQAATQKLGPAKLNSLNSGSDSGNADSKELNDKLLAKLDELISTSKEGGKGVTVNVTSDGKEKSTEDSGSSEKDKNLSRKIKEAVVKVLQEEKRLGGVLRRS